MGTANSDTKKQQFKYFLQADSAADEWFEELQLNEKKDWDAIETAFNKCWPRKRAAKKTKEEYEEEITGLRLSIDDLGKKEKTAGRDVYSHIVWADKMEIIVRGGKNRNDDNLHWTRQEGTSQIGERESRNRALGLDGISSGCQGRRHRPHKRWSKHVEEGTGGTERPQKMCPTTGETHQFAHSTAAPPNDNVQHREHTGERSTTNEANVRTPNQPLPRHHRGKRQSIHAQSQQTNTHTRRQSCVTHMPQEIPAPSRHRPRQKSPPGTTGGLGKDAWGKRGSHGVNTLPPASRNVTGRVRRVLHMRIWRSHGQARW